jgi:hypothetical protein
MPRKTAPSADELVCDPSNAPDSVVTCGAETVPSPAFNKTNKQRMMGVRNICFVPASITQGVAQYVPAFARGCKELRRTACDFVEIVLTKLRSEDYAAAGLEQSRQCKDVLGRNPNAFILHLASGVSCEGRCHLNWSSFFWTSSFG